MAQWQVDIVHPRHYFIFDALEPDYRIEIHNPVGGPLGIWIVKMTSSYFDRSVMNAYTTRTFGPALPTNWVLIV